MGCPAMIPKWESRKTPLEGGRKAMQGERLNVNFSVTGKERGISMYMTNEGWEQNNQDYLKESYEKTGFTAGGCGK